MKVIDLLYKIANGEEVPKIIKYHNIIFFYEEDYVDYINYNGCSLFEHYGDKNEIYKVTNMLNDEVEILEDIPKVQVEMTQEEYNKYLDKQIEYMEKVKNNKPNPSYLSPKEEKKIPDKLKKYHFHNRQRQLANKINEIIDCLKSRCKEVNEDEERNN